MTPLLSQFRLVLTGKCQDVIAAEMPPCATSCGERRLRKNANYAWLVQAFCSECFRIGLRVEDAWYKYGRQPRVGQFQMLSSERRAQYFDLKLQVDLYKYGRETKNRLWVRNIKRPMGISIFRDRVR